jgi:hypothetical protein
MHRVRVTRTVQVQRVNPSRPRRLLLTRIRHVLRWQRSRSPRGNVALDQIDKERSEWLA